MRRFVFLPNGPPLPYTRSRRSCQRMFSLVRPASSETRSPVSSSVEITTFSIPERQALASRSAFSFVNGSRLYWYIVRILQIKRTIYAHLNKALQGGGIWKLGKVRFYSPKANGTPVRYGLRVLNSFRRAGKRSRWPLLLSPVRFK